MGIVVPALSVVVRVELNYIEIDVAAGISLFNGAKVGDAGVARDGDVSTALPTRGELAKPLSTLPAWPPVRVCSVMLVVLLPTVKLKTRAK